MSGVRGYENIEAIATEIITHSVANPLLEHAVGRLALRMVATALFNPDNRQRDFALTGMLYPRSVSLGLAERGSQGYAAPWFVQAEFAVRGRPSKVLVRTTFLRPSVITDLRSPEIRELAREDTTIEHLIPLGEPIERDIRRKIVIEGIKEQREVWLKAKLRSTVNNEGDYYRVTVRLENLSGETDGDGGISPSFNLKRALKQVAYRSAFALYAPLIIAEVEGGIEEIVAQDSPSASDDLSAGMPKPISLNCFTRRSQAGRALVFSSPVIVYDRLAKIPEPHSDWEDVAGADHHMELVLRVISDEEKITRLFKHQAVTLKLFAEYLQRATRSKCVLSEIPTAFGKTLTASAMALYAALKGRGTGTKALLLFPTRVLTIQQLTALAKYIYRINQEIKQENHGRGKGITLGLYIGRGSGEDRVYEPSQLITECPICGGRGQFEPDRQLGRLSPRCTTCRGILDYILLDDRETQAYCPDIVVATPDKLVHELQTDPSAHILIGAPMLRCESCGRAYPKLGDRKECRQCKGTLGSAEHHSDIRFVFLDEFTLLSGSTASRLSHFIRLLRWLKRTYGLSDDIVFFLACATAANPLDFACKLIGLRGEDVVVLRGDDYFKEGDWTWQRIIVIYPWEVSTRGSVSWGVVAIAKAWHGLEGGQRDAYGKQLIYVQRRDDGHNLYRYIPDLASSISVDPGEFIFFHGDLDPSELAYNKSRAREASRGVLIGTSTLGWGVHMPWLNVAHVWGAPYSTAEFFQVIGRVGREVVREQELPALVVLHLFPGYPRDVWLYDNFIKWFKNPAFESELIDPYNIAIVRSTIPSVIACMLLSRLYTKYNAGFAWPRLGEILDRCRRDGELNNIFEEALTNIFSVGLDESDKRRDGVKDALGELYGDLLYRPLSSARKVTDAIPEIAYFSLRGSERAAIYKPKGSLLIMLPRLQRIGPTIAEDSAEELDFGGEEV
jgi:hypothetical protein